MTITETVTVPFGLSDAIPPHAKAAWGARFIVGQDGYVDLPPDRQGFGGTMEARRKLMDRMNETFPMPRLIEAIRDDLIEGVLNTREAEQVRIAKVGTLVVVGNTKASAGYLYVAAFIDEVG